MWLFCGMIGAMRRLAAPLGLLLGLALVQTVIPQTSLPQNSQPISFDGIVLDIKSVTKLLTPSASYVYQIEGGYKSKTQFLLNGMPHSAGQGTLLFLSTEPKLAFADPRSGWVTKTVLLDRFDIPAGSSKIDLPERSDFPAPVPHPFASSDPKTNEQNVAEALSEYFPQGVLSLTYTPPAQIISYCRALEEVTAPYRGKVAIMLEYPVDVRARGDGYRLSSVIYESRTGSSSWPIASTGQVVKAGTAFVGKFISRLSGGQTR
jgi:hypothetical protein